MTANRPPHYRFDLRPNAWGQLVFSDTEGREFVGAEPARMFPVSDPDHWVSICDAEGHEILCIEDLRSLPEEVRQGLREELDRREFVPIILRIVRASTDFEPAEWQVETDRGPTTFEVGSEDDVRLLEPQRVMVTDTHGVRYLIPDTRQINVASRRILDRYL